LDLAKYLLKKVELGSILSNNPSLDVELLYLRFKIHSILLEVKLKAIDPAESIKPAKYESKVISLYSGLRIFILHSLQAFLKL
jgi:hypothetical protein